MRVFAIAALGSVLVAGCAPFEHGHYATDVSYRNTTGDPAGTPLVYQANPVNRAVYDPTALASAQTGHSYTQTAYVAPQQVSYSTPVTYSAPTVQSYTAQPTYTTATSYVEPAVQSTYSHTPTTQTYGTIATTYGGPRIDADGYAICDIPWPSHGAHQTPRF